MIWNKQIKIGTRYENEYDISDTSIFTDSKYFDVFIEYAKNDDEDICIRITVYNRSADNAPITVLPTLWMRNLWSYGLTNKKPSIKWIKNNETNSELKITHALMGDYSFYFQNQ